MIRKTLIAAAVVSAMASATPAMATWNKPKHNHSCHCGHIKCGSSTTSSTSGNTSTSTTSGNTSTSTTSGNTSTSSGTQVPEPGTLGLLGAGLLGLGFATRRRRRAA